LQKNQIQNRMYGREGLEDILFLIIYGGAAILSLAACFYLLFRRKNVIAPHVESSKTLRRWTATFFAFVSLSHVWWYAIGNLWLTDDMQLRNIFTITLDRITLVPFAIAVLLRMLQDKERALWPWFVAHIPILLAAVLGVVKHDYSVQTVIRLWQIGILVVFAIYYWFAVIQYGHWLNENYADLQNKEVWQSLAIAFSLFALYSIYSSNMGQLVLEYLSQVDTFLVIGFFLWRVETLQTLGEKTETSEPDSPRVAFTLPDNIGVLLTRFCEEEQLYLQYDLNLRQLATAIGTNRTYLSTYFSTRGETYNAYINRLRIEHFIRLFHENPSATAQELSLESGYGSYSTFSSAFKKITGSSVRAWMQSQNKL